VVLSNTPVETPNAPDVKPFSRSVCGRVLSSAATLNARFRSSGDAMSEAENPKTNQPKCQTPSRRRRRKDGLNISAKIDDFFNTRIAATEGERSRYMICFQVILHHLWIQATAGNRKAGKLFVRYMNFAASQGSSAGFDVRIIPDPPEDEEAK
jgi:hypothetical protein